MSRSGQHPRTARRIALYSAIGFALAVGSASADLCDYEFGVDDADLGTAFSRWTGPIGATGGKTCNDGDTDDDGDVDDADLGTLFAVFTGPFFAPADPYNPYAVDNILRVDPMYEETGEVLCMGEDGDIDDSDLGTAFTHWTGPIGAAGDKSCYDGDTDGDGDIDDGDLGTLFAAFTGPNDPGPGPFPGISSASLDNILHIDPMDITLPGDTDGDGDVDDSDLATMFSNFSIGITTEKTAAQGDTDGDGDVDDSDLANAFSNWTGPLGPTSVAVPEPSSLVLLTLGAAGFVNRRKRHAHR